MAITKVTTDVITALAVTAPKLAANAVTTDKLADNAVTAAKIAAGALGDQVAGITSSASATTIAGTLTSTGTITGTLATAAQTNITSLGTLTALTTSGNVGIGGAAADPQGFGRALHVEGGTNAAIYLRDTGNSNYGYIGFIGGTTNKTSLNSYQGTLAFTTGAGVSAMTIDANQKVSIASSTSAGALLTVHNSFSSDANNVLLVRGGANESDGKVLEVQDHAGNSDFSVMGDGKVLIGTAEAATIGKAIVMAMVFG